MTEDAVTRGWTDDLGRFRPYCRGTTKRGTKCRATAIGASNPYCITHDPLGNGLSPKQNAIREQFANMTQEEAAAIFGLPKRRRSTRMTAAKAQEFIAAIDAVAECKDLNGTARAALDGARGAMEKYLA